MSIKDPVALDHQQPIIKYPFQDDQVSNITREAIVQALPNAPKLNPIFGGHSPLQISPSFVVKRGSHTQLSEALMMRYVARNTSIPVPKVIDAWQSDTKDEGEIRPECFIVMEYVEGDLVRDVLGGLDATTRNNLYNQIVAYIRQLRSLNNDIPGPLGGCIAEESFFTSYGAGPFSSRQDIEKWFNDRLLVCHDFGHAQDTPVNWFSGKFDVLVPCHLDLDLHNMILDKAGVLWILDWQGSGFYPPFFETANFKWGNSEFGKSIIEKLEIGNEEVRDINHLLSITFAITTASLTQPQLKDDGEN